jgi:hypothetical protein
VCRLLDELGRAPPRLHADPVHLQQQQHRQQQQFNANSQQQFNANSNLAVDMGSRTDKRTTRHDKPRATKVGINWPLPGYCTWYMVIIIHSIGRYAFLFMHSMHKARGAYVFSLHLPCRGLPGRPVLAHGQRHAQHAIPAVQVLHLWI